MNTDKLDIWLLTCRPLEAAGHTSFEKSAKDRMLTHGGSVAEPPIGVEGQ